jgi:nucleoside-diphosphate-sugar epimerase
MAKLIFGCGYLGLRVARRWRSAGETVYAVTRSAQRAEQLAAEGINSLVANLAGDSQVVLPQDVETVLFAVGYDRACDRTMHEVCAGGLERAIRWLPPAVERFFFMSSTGVYGQVDGETVDEDSTCQPEREGGRACLAAEELLRASRIGPQSIILRLAGLYGPGRIPRAKELIAGQPIAAPASGWLNLIHVEDAAQIVLLAEARTRPPRTYVVSDGQPVERREYYQELARLLGAPPPRFIDSPPDSAAVERASSNKRVDSRRMFDELAPVLQFPSYRDGLAAIVAGVSS